MFKGDLADDLQLPTEVEQERSVADLEDLDTIDSLDPYHHGVRVISVRGIEGDVH